MPAIGSVLGNRSVVMPAASWRIRSSRFRYSSFWLALAASAYQPSKATVLWMSAGIWLS